MPIKISDLSVLLAFFLPKRFFRNQEESGVSKRVGIWVDSRKAFIVSVTREAENAEAKNRTRVVRIDSDVESHARLSGGSRTGKTPYGPQDVAVDGRLDERRRRQLRKYFQEIIGQVKNAKRILIFGPGPTKFELEKEMKKSRELAAKLLPVETTDKLTENQIAAKVKAFFNSQT